MTPMLDVPAVRQRVHLLTVDDYHRMGEAGVFQEDVELLRGIVVKKMPKSPLHEYVAAKLEIIIRTSVPPEFQVRIERPLSLNKSEPEPDISVVRGRPEDWLQAHPSTAHLVVEVAVSSEVLDRSKAEIYAEANVLEYWIVLAESQTIEVYRTPTPEGYLDRSLIPRGEVLHSNAVPEVQFDSSSIFPALG